MRFSIIVIDKIAKLANSASSFKFRQVKYSQNIIKLVLRMIKFAFHTEKLNDIDTVCEKYIFIILKTVCCRDLKGLAK